MFTVGGGDGASDTFLSRDSGLTWTKGSTSGIKKPDKDDLNIIFNQGRFVDMQIVWQVGVLTYSPENTSPRTCRIGPSSTATMVVATRGTATTTSHIQ